jgi:hypothetical protein
MDTTVYINNRIILGKEYEINLSYLELKFLELSYDTYQSQYSEQMKKIKQLEIKKHKMLCETLKLDLEYFKTQRNIV